MYDACISSSPFSSLSFSSFSSFTQPALSRMEHGSGQGFFLLMGGFQLQAEALGLCKGPLDGNRCRVEIELNRTEYISA